MKSPAEDNHTRGQLMLDFIEVRDRVALLKVRISKGVISLHDAARALAAGQDLAKEFDAELFDTAHWLAVTTELGELEQRLSNLTWQLKSLGLEVK